MATQRSFRSAIKWSFAGIWGERSLIALFTVILAALLGPKDFGLVAIAWIFVTFIQMFLDQGLVAALIQKQDLQQEHLDSVFWMDIGLSLLLVGISITLSHWWAAVNHAPQVATIISALSLCIPIEGLAIVQKTMLSKSMDFKGLSIRSAIAALVGGLVGVAMAFAKAGPWALVGQQITKDVVSLVLLWRISPWRPRGAFSWSHLRELMGFSLSNFTAQLGIFVDTQAASILVGIFLGPIPVGLYRLADRIMNSVVVACTSSIQAVALPEFSRWQDNPVELHRSALLCIRLSSTVTLPALACVAAVSDSLMATLGPQWIPAADVLKVLCALGMVIIFAYFTGPLLQALGRPHILAALEWARTGLGVCLLVAAGLIVRHARMEVQILALALARLLTGALVITPVFLYVLMRLTKLTMREFIRSIAPSLSSSACIVAAVLVIRALHFLSAYKPPIVLAVEIICGVLTGLPVLFGLDSQLRREVQQRFRWA
jgi:O-antigen/teichoic acid export membrane protein